MARLTRSDSKIILDGRLTVDTVTGVYNEAPVLGKGVVEVDLADVEEMDSAGLALLVHWKQQSARQDGHMNLVNTPQQVATMIRISNLETLLEQK